MPKSQKVPDNWPATLPYLSMPILAPGVPKDILSTQALHSPSLEPNTITIALPATPYTNIRITPIHDPDHPAFGQCGLFTARAHPPDSFICLYLGLVHQSTSAEPSEKKPVQEHVPKSDYDLSLDRDLDLAIDAASMGNEARFTNDYRGIADRPNAEFRDVIVRGKGGKKERGVGIFVKAVKKPKKGKARKEDEVGIKKGEEVLVSYGRAFWSARRTEAAEAVEVAASTGST